jgi:alcohol dehydrogenase class IV
LQDIINGIGSTESLRKILSPYDDPRVLLVSGKNSFKLSGAKTAIDTALKNYKYTHFYDFQVNPQIEDVEEGVRIARSNGINLIVAIGGGSVLDMAKLIKACFDESHDVESIIKGLSVIVNPNIPLIAIPTTAGSGSESTHFAVAYINKDKFSVADDCLMPNNVILDGLLCISATKYQKTCNALDALAQGIESMWAVNSNINSREIAHEAVLNCFKNINDYVNDTNKNAEISQIALEAANLAGQAINISKTTAPHAWSYAISTNYNLPHGHAVWITLPKIFVIHAEFSETGLSSNELKEAMVKLKLILGISSKTNITEYFNKFLKDMDIAFDLSADFNLTDDEKLILSKSVNQERLLNNPVVFNEAQINKIFNLF